MGFLPIYKEFDFRRQVGTLNGDGSITLDEGFDVKDLATGKAQLIPVFRSFPVPVEMVRILGFGIITRPDGPPPDLDTL